MDLVKGLLEFKNKQEAQNTKEVELKKIMNSYLRKMEKWKKNYPEYIQLIEEKNQILKEKLKEFENKI